MVAEQFADDADKVMRFAREEALRLGYAYLAPEHILLGLIRGGAGIAAQVLTEFGVDLPSTVEELQKLHTPPKQDSLPGEVLPYSPQIKPVLAGSVKVSRLFGASHVDTEHLLLGLLYLEEGVPLRLLRELKVDPEKVWQRVMELIRDEGGSSVGIFECISDSRCYPSYGALLVAFDSLIDLLDKKVFEAAYIAGFDLKQQGERALSVEFQVPIKTERDVVLWQRDALAKLLGFSKRTPHDLAPRDYVVAECGTLVPRS